MGGGVDGWLSGVVSVVSELLSGPAPAAILCLNPLRPR